MFFYFHQSAEVEVVFFSTACVFVSRMAQKLPNFQKHGEEMEDGEKKENLGISFVDRVYCANILSYPSFFK